MHAAIWGHQGVMWHSSGWVLRAILRAIQRPMLRQHANVKRLINTWKVLAQNNMDDTFAELATSGSRRSSWCSPVLTQCSTGHEVRCSSSDHARSDGTFKHTALKSTRPSAIIRRTIRLSCQESANSISAMEPPKRVICFIINALSCADDNTFEL